MKKNTIIGAILIVLAIVGIYFFANSSSEENYEDVSDQNESEMTAEDNSQQADEVIETGKSVVAIGKSAEDKDIVAYRYGTGDTEVLFVGGTHGGYSWNTALLGYQLVEYFDANPDVVPANVTASVIPVLNPDGLEKVAGTYGKFSASDVTATDSQKVTARFNANNVDLNRNFDCDWESVGTWQSREVDGGDSAFSEPESQAIKNYIERYGIDSAIVYYSSAGGVFASSCHNGILSETRDLTNAYADASGYPAYEEFDFYEITGDMVNWMAKMQIPAISVLLTDHTNTEWSKNLKGIQAVLNYYAE
jgi:hypothetical protein